MLASYCQINEKILFGKRGLQLIQWPHPLPPKYKHGFGDKFLTSDWSGMTQPTILVEASRQMVLGHMRKQTEQLIHVEKVKKKHFSMFSDWIPTSVVLLWVLDLISTHKKIKIECWNKVFLTQIYFAIVFSQQKKAYWNNYEYGIMHVVTNILYLIFVSQHIFSWMICIIL